MINIWKMSNLTWFSIVLCFAVKTSYSQKKMVELAGTEAIQFKSAVNSQVYILDIFLPGNYSDSTKKWPVVYVLDGQWSFPFIAGVHGIVESLFYDGLIPEMIVVGIKWTGDYDVNRQRDFTPPRLSNHEGVSEIFSR